MWADAVSDDGGEEPSEAWGRRRPLNGGKAGAAGAAGAAKSHHSDSLHFGPFFVFLAVPGSDSTERDPGAPGMFVTGEAAPHIPTSALFLRTRADF